MSDQDRDRELFLRLEDFLLEDFLPEDFLLEDFLLPEDFFRLERFFAGTFAPFLRASERPIAIAWSRLFTLPPRPDLPRRSVPRLRRRMALSTLLLAFLPYRRPLDLREVLFLAAMLPPEIGGGSNLRWNGPTWQGSGPVGTLRPARHYHQRMT